MNLLPTRNVELRNYQRAAIDQVHEAIAQGSRAPLLVLPTGSGKTVIASELIRRHVENQGRALFLAPRRELIHQASGKLHDVGIDHGVLLAGCDDLRNYYAPVQVASIDTTISRLRRRTVLPPELLRINLVIVDEAHLSITARRQHLLGHWPDAVLVGLTATPTRKDGRALGILYDRLIEPTTTAKLTTEGYLAPARYFSVSEPDLQRVKLVAGDYHQGELESAMNRAELVGDVVGTWLQRAADRRTIVFCCSVAHSIAMTEAFLRAGVAAEHIDGTLPTPEREGIIARFRSGETQVLTNCFVASYGFDLPEVSCIALARPTKSMMLYLQMLGRGLRTTEGKSDCLILDHSGCVHRHGFAADEREWTLEGERALVERERTPKEKAESKLIDCPECHAVYSGTRTCPECGYRIPTRGKEVVTLDGELVEVGEYLSSQAQDQLAFFLELKGYARLKNYKPGYAGVKFKERFAEWPPKSWDRLPAVTPSIGTQRWIQSRNIAWAKSQAKLQAGGAYR